MTDTESSREMSTSTLISIALGALVAAAVAFFITTRIIGGGTPSLAEVCEDSKAEIRAIIAENPDTESLGPAEDAILNAAATELRSSCTYTDTVDFESVEVFPWLGVDPYADPSLDPALDPSLSTSPSADTSSQ